MDRQGAGTGVANDARSKSGLGSSRSSAKPSRSGEMSKPAPGAKAGVGPYRVPKTRPVATMLPKTRTSKVAGNAQASKVAANVQVRPPAGTSLQNCLGNECALNM